MRGRASLVVDLPVLRAWSPEELASVHVWHSDDGDSLDVWCVLGPTDARSLLRVVLQGPAGAEPTPLERNIVRDTIERLLTATGRLWEERAAAQLPPSLGWCCRLTLTDALGTTSTFTLHAPSTRFQLSAIAHVDLRTVPVSLDALLPTLDLQVDAVARWRNGDFVALACGPDAAVCFRIGSTCVASGSLGASRGHRAILVSRQA